MRRQNFSFLALDHLWLKLLAAELLMLTEQDLSILALSFFNSCHSLIVFFGVFPFLDDISITCQASMKSLHFFWLWQLLWIPQVIAICTGIAASRSEFLFQMVIFPIIYFLLFCISSSWFYSFINLINNYSQHLLGNILLSLWRHDFL